jgi:hypothetical protein
VGQKKDACGVGSRPKFRRLVFVRKTDEPAAGSLNRTKNDAKKDAAHQIGGYGDKSSTLKGELTPKLG